MPELPEVETTRRGISPHIQGQKVEEFVVRNYQLRWPIPSELHDLLPGMVVQSTERRAKYLLIHFESGALILHLGMSGSLRIVERDQQVGKHDHLDLCLSNGKVLRLTDPRRFGACLWQPKGQLHDLLASLGPEPLSDAFNTELLVDKAKSRRVAVKNFIMDNKVVVGVGNIYANEALFLAGIDPRKPANQLTEVQLCYLVEQIKLVLQKAISQGGTTLKDFVGGDGKPGYFAQQLYVYGRAGQSCRICDEKLQEVKIGQRATVFCPQCQQ